MYFVGRHEHSLDDKSRLMLPTRLRDQLKGQLYVTLGLDKCINLYTNGGFMRIFFSTSQECEMDKQGRILLPRSLQKLASISKDVIIIGNNDHVEIWDKKNYEQVELDQLDLFEENAEKIGAKYFKED